MSFKDELDEKMRKNRLTAKLKPPQEEIDRKAQEDAQFLWNKLKKLFLNGGSHIEIGFLYDNNKPAKVYYHMRYPHNAFCHLLTLKKIKYPVETNRFLWEIAESEELYIFPHHQKGMRGTWYKDLWANWTEYIYRPPMD